MKPERMAEIAKKLDEIENMTFENWTPQRVARNMIAAGRRRNRGDTPFEFPGYVKFPRKLFNPSDLSHLPFQASDTDARYLLGYLISGDCAWMEMIDEFEEYMAASIAKLRKDHAPAKKPAETNVPGPSNAVPTEGPSNAAQMNASDFVEPNVPNDVSPINPSGFVHTGPTNDALVDAVQPGTSNLIPDNAATSAQGVSNPASMNIPSGVVQVDVNLLAPLDEDDLPGINNAANDGNQVLGNNDAPTGTVQSDFGDNYGLRRRDILEYFDATGRVQPHIDDPEFDAQQGDAAQVDAAQGNAAQDDAIQVDAPQADAPHVGRIDDVRGHHAGGRRPPNDRDVVDNVSGREPQQNDAPDTRNDNENMENFLMVLKQEGDVQPVAPNAQPIDVDAPQIDAAEQVQQQQLQQLLLDDDIPMGPLAVQPIHPISGAGFVASTPIPAEQAQARQQIDAAEQVQQRQFQQLSLDDDVPMVVPATQPIHPISGVGLATNTPVPEVQPQVQADLPQDLQERRRTSRSLTPNLDRAIKKLGQDRRPRSLTRQDRIKRTAGAVRTHTPDPTDSLIQRVSENDYEFHPRIGDRPDYTIYFDRILKHLIDHDPRPVPIRTYLNGLDTEYNRLCAINAMANAATGGLVRIDRDVNGTITGFQRIR